MSAGLLVVGIAVLACAAAGVLLAAAWERGLATGGLMLVSAATTLLLAAATAIFAWQAARRMRDMTTEIDRLARSVDAALGDLAARADRERAEIAELRQLVFREPRVAERPILFEAPPPEPAPAEPPVPAPAADATLEPQAGELPRDAVTPQPGDLPRDAATPQPAALPVPPPPDGGPEEPFISQVSEEGVEAAIVEMMKAGKVELSVQPIISVARGAVRGHDVHVRIAAGERELHLRRMQRPAGAARASFERLVLVSAADAARRRAVPAGAAMPLHVAVSDALLGDERELAKVFDVLRSQPVLARSLILSLPSDIAAADHRPALRRLAAAGIRLAVEGWDASKAEFEILQRSGLRYLTVPADRLLDRGGPDASPAEALLDLAAETGVEIIATGVGTDEDAVALLNLDVDLMSGARFAGPQHLTQEAGRKPPPARASRS